MLSTEKSPRIPEDPGSWTLFFSFFRLGMTAFGGPAMIAHIRELALRRNRWLSEESFRDGVILCQSMPGATAMQMAAYVGLRASGLRGAAASYIGFGLPAFLFMLALSAAYTGSREMPVAAALFRGLQLLVVAILAHATFVFGKEIARKGRDLLLAPVSAALFAIGTSPFLVILLAALGGILLFRDAPASAQDPGESSETKDVAEQRETARFLRSILLFAMAAVASVAALRLADRALFELAALMLRIDVFAFGGGFASLPLMFHEVVNARGWMSGATFMDGVALGQVTPGPIIITAAFVGYLVAGVPGALAATAAIFTPSFIVLTAVAPFFDRLKGSRYFSGATRGILASFVGLLFYMTLRFAWAVPWDIPSVLFWAAALVALARKANILHVVLAGSVLSVLIFR